MERRAFVMGTLLCSVCGLAHAQQSENGGDQDYTCTIIPPGDPDAATFDAVEEWDGNTVNPNQPGRETALEKAKRWNPSKKQLKVYFIHDGTLSNRVLTAAKGWEAYMPLRFVRVNSPDGAEIVVDFQPGRGHYSAIGTDTWQVQQEYGHSMNFGWTNNPSNNDVNRVALHEFGHAMSLVHEHRVPNSGIDWDVPAVYAYYLATQRWNQAKVKKNVIDRYNEDQLIRTAYDPQSIMHYPVPRFLVTDPNDVVGWNSQLSPADKAMASYMWKT